jgi:hypothetical protein
LQKKSRLKTDAGYCFPALEGDALNQAVVTNDAFPSFLAAERVVAEHVEVPGCGHAVVQLRLKRRLIKVRKHALNVVV